MAGKWDSILKLLLRYDSQQFVSWLLKGAVLTEELSVEIKRRDIYADALFKVKLDGEPMLLEVEIQSTNKKLMPERLQEYNIQASRAYDHLPVLTCVIYLFDDGKVPVPPYIKTLPNGYEVHRFNYLCIELWKIRAEEILQEGLVGLYPLLTLTANGKRLEVVDTMIEGITPTGNNELLSLAYTLAGLVFKDPEDLEMLRRSFAMLGDDILEMSATYQEIKQKGLQEGRKEGRQQGLKEGRQQGLQQGLQQESQDLRDVLIKAVQVHYPSQVSLATKRAQAINEPHILQDAILKLLTARDENEVQNILLAIAPEAE